MKKNKKLYSGKRPVMFYQTDDGIGDWDRIRIFYPGERCEFEYLNSDFVGNISSYCFGAIPCWIDDKYPYSIEHSIRLCEDYMKNNFGYPKQEFICEL